MERHLIALIVLALPTVCSAAVPTLIAKIDLDAPVVELRVASDGKRAVALLNPSGGRQAGLRVIDTSRPEAPIAKGFLSTPSGKLVLAPDGRRALLLVQLEQKKYNTATRHALIAVDLSNPDAPKELWHREILARNVVLAEDASAYATSQSAGSKEGRWQTAVTWVNNERPQILLEEDHHSPPNMQFSERASFLLFSIFEYEFRLFDLRSITPVRYDQENYAWYSRYGCVPAILESGHIVVEDTRAPRIGIYAHHDKIPRIATLPHDGIPHCALLNRGGTDGNLLLADSLGRIHRVDLRQPERPAFTGMWQLPAGTTLRAVASSVLYASGDMNSQQLLVFRLDVPAPAAVDWRALDAAHRAAMERYRQDLREGKPIPYFSAARRMEEAGVLLALDAPVEGISQRRAAAILNDYGFLAWKSSAESILADPALRRAIALEPNRPLAMLNLADGLRERLASLTDYSARRARMAEIQALYRKYLALGGKRNAGIDAFLEGEPGGAEGQDICRAMVRYANAGRLRELISGVGINILASERRVDVAFTTEGTAHVPVAYAFDADTDYSLEDGWIAIPDRDSLWGGDKLGLVVYGDAAHILHFRDFRHPVATSSLSDEATCRFRTQTVEKVGLKASEPALCRSLSRGKNPTEISFETPAPIDRSSVRERYRETGAGGMRRIDFANNGQPVTVAELEMTSGAGPGCGARFYDVLDEDGQTLATGSNHKMLAKLQNLNPANPFPMLPCGNQARFFTYRGKTYFENKPATWPPIDDWNQYHRVARIDQGKVLDVCDFRFGSTISVEP